MARGVKKTHDEFVAEVKALVGDEYTVGSAYLGSKSKITIKHSLCGIEYKVTPSNLLKGRKCPSCAGVMKKTNTVFRDKVMSLVGREYKVLSEYINANHKISFKHSLCGHVYEQIPNSFLRGYRCPKCAGNKKSTHSEYVDSVKSLTGEDYTVLGNYINSNTKILMRHEVCGHEYKIRPTNFTTQGSRCPKCSAIRGGQKGRLSPEEFRIRFNSILSDDYTLKSEYTSGETKVSVYHKVCMTTYLANPKDILYNKSGCPACKESKGERKIRGWLLSNGIKFDGQVPIKYDVQKQPLFLDFYVQRVAIEYDGRQHYEAVDFWGGVAALRETQRRDAIKTKYCADNNIPLIRIPYWEYDNIDAILTEKLLPLLYNTDKRNAS